MSPLTISISELRNHFDEYLQRVKSGEVFIITKYGKPIAQLTPVQEIEEEQKIHRPKAKRRPRES